MEEDYWDEARASECGLVFRDDLEQSVAIVVFFRAGPDFEALLLHARHPISTSFRIFPPFYRLLDKGILNKPQQRCF